MDELLTLVAAGALIPAISLIIKKLVVDKVFENLNKEISIKNKEGKEFKFIINPGTSNDEIKDIFESELRFEAEVKKHLEKFVRTHKKYEFQLSNGKNLDFLLLHKDRKIGIEAKFDAKRFKAKWIYNYFKENSDIDELIMIVSSNIPDSLIKEVERHENNIKIKLISPQKGKGLSKSIGNILEKELELNKMPQRTNQ